MAVLPNPERANGDLLLALESPDVHVRRKAAQALCQSLDEQSSSAIVTRLFDSDAEVVQHLFCSLARVSYFDDETVRRIISRIFLPDLMPKEHPEILSSESLSYITWIVRNIGQRFVSGVASYLVHSDPRCRHRAIFLLKFAQSDIHVLTPYFQLALIDSDPWVRFEAINCVIHDSRRIGDSALTSTLETLFRDDHERLIRAFADYALFAVRFPNHETRLASLATIISCARGCDGLNHQIKAATAIAWIMPSEEGLAAFTVLLDTFLRADTIAFLSEASETIRILITRSNLAAEWFRSRFENANDFGLTNILSIVTPQVIEFFREYIPLLLHHSSEVIRSKTIDRLENIGCLWALQSQSLLGASKSPDV